MLGLLREFGAKVKAVRNWINNKYPLFEGLFDEKDPEKSSSILTKLLFNILIYAVIAGGTLLFIDITLIFITDKGGVFGDFFGGVLNPIFTFLTLFGLITTIVIQRQELRLARVEYGKTADALSTQAIETTFFNILDLHHTIADNIKVDLDELKGKSLGESFTETAASAILSSMTSVQLKNNALFEGRGVFSEILEFISIKSKSPEEALERYKVIQNNYNHVLGHYFRNLYQALKIIDNYDESLLTKGQKRKYTGILRAQLSTKELALLFLNCLEGMTDSGQFKNLLIEYAMLEHLPIKKVKGGYSLSGSPEPVANDAMFLQYKNKKELGFDLNKYYGGAFGENKGVPYNLRPKK